MSTDPCNLKKLLSNFLLKVVDAVCVGCPVELLVEAQGSVNFDPGYQRLTFHTLNVIRGGKVLGRLGSTRIQVLQRETELEYLIYDGSMTASTMLDDVRIGDIVEYAYSIAGSNPVFRNHAAGTLSLAWSVPLERAYTRLLMPSAPALVYQRRFGDCKDKALLMVWRTCSSPTTARRCNMSTTMGAATRDWLRPARSRSRTNRREIR